MARGDGFVRKRQYRLKSGAFSTRWIASVDLGPGVDAKGRKRDRVREDRVFSRREDAKDWLASRRAELRTRRAPVDRRSSRLTVKGVLDAYIEHGTTLGEWSLSHTRRTRQIVATDLSGLHDVRVEELTVADVEDVIAARMAAGVKPNTIRLMRNALSAALNLAISREQLSPWANVASRAHAPTVRRELPHFIPPHLVPAFFDRLEGERFRPLIITAVAGALRPSETIGLYWSDIDLDARELTIRRTIQYEGGRYVVRDRPKDDEARTIAMPRFLVELLREHRKEQMAERERDYAGFVPRAARTPAQRQKESLRLRRHEARRERRKANDDAWAGLVFTARDGGPVYESGVGRRLRAIIDRINQERLDEARRVASGVGDAPELLPHVTFYQLRHTGATWMLANGVPEHELQAIMGHSSPAMTRRYAAVLQPQRLAAADRLDAALRDAGGVQREERDEATPAKDVAR